jgi:hypothetical protein
VKHRFSVVYCEKSNVNPFVTTPQRIMAQKHAVSQFDGIVAGPEAEYATLIEKTEPPDGHKGVQGHVRITRMAKIVFGWGFCAENMFDVAGDTLLTKFYNGASTHCKLGVISSVFDWRLPLCSLY